MTRLRCPGCGAGREAGLPLALECPCGDLFEIDRPTPRPGAIARPGDSGRSGKSGRSGVWRFHALIDPEVDPADVVSLHEGSTPLFEAPPVAAFVGCEDVALKHEGLNPTGSFKDRGMTVAITRARMWKAPRVACASTGNTAASLAAYAARAGLEAVVLAPERGTAVGKLSQALAYGARTLLLRGDFDAGMAVLRRSAAELGLHLVNSINPFRLEGQKTIVLEACADRGWRAPDWIVFPAGNLGNCTAFGQALVEAHALGWIDALPRLAAIQAAGASPFARSFRTAFERLEPVVPSTVASAIRIGNPVSFRRAVRSIRATNGVVTDVSDEEILAAKVVVDRAGIGAEPASCAAVAGARKLVHEGTIARDASVVCVLTGHLLKDPDANLMLHRGELPVAEAADVRAPGSNVPRVVDPDPEALRRALA